MKRNIDPEKLIDIIENKENLKLLECQKYMIRKWISEINEDKIPVCYELQTALDRLRQEEVMFNETLPTSGESG